MATVSVASSTFICLRSTFGGLTASAGLQASICQRTACWRASRSTRCMWVTVRAESLPVPSLRPLASDFVSANLPAAAQCSCGKARHSARATGAILAPACAEPAIEEGGDSQPGRLDGGARLQLRKQPGTLDLRLALAAGETMPAALARAGPRIAYVDDDGPMSERSDSMNASLSKRMTRGQSSRPG